MRWREDGEKGRGGRREKSRREVERRERGGEKKGGEEGGVEKRRLADSKHNVTQMSSTPLGNVSVDMAHTNTHIQPTFPEVHPSSWWDAVFPFLFSMST